LPSGSDREAAGRVETLPPREAIREFSLQARLSITQRDERWLLGMAWHHQPDGEALSFLSPLGTVLATLSATALGAQLQVSEKEWLEAPTLDALAERAVGFTLPLSALPDWVLGRAHQVEPEGVRDEKGRWQQFVQAGWKVAFLEYQSESPRALPRRIHITREEVSVRIVMDQWIIHGR
jgi:outer membrane lipoprotein LolB